MPGIESVYGQLVLEPLIPRLRVALLVAKKLEAHSFGGHFLGAQEETSIPVLCLHSGYVASKRSDVVKLPK